MPADALIEDEGWVDLGGEHFAAVRYDASGARLSLLVAHVNPLTDTWCYVSLRLRPDSSGAFPHYRVGPWSPLTVNGEVVCPQCGTTGWIRYGAWWDAVSDPNVEADQ